MNESSIVAEIGEEILASCAVIPAGYALDAGIQAAGSVGGGRESSAPRIASRSDARTG
ncbi:MAG TPA: hypothetical protein QGF05_06925 [Dehalococcoidia bacterium]|nr:hypothetical protein [Dehalococcoidia bacterium]